MDAETREAKIIEYSKQGMTYEQVREAITAEGGETPSVSYIASVRNRAGLMTQKRERVKKVRPLPAPIREVLGERVQEPKAPPMEELPSIFAELQAHARKVLRRINEKSIRIDSDGSITFAAS